MKLLRVLLLYTINLFLFGGWFLAGVYASSRFILGLLMEVLNYPTGIAAVFPKIIALIAGLGGGFWGIFLAAFVVRFLARHFLEGMDLGERPILNITISSFIGFLFVLMILVAFFGERADLSMVLKILLET